MTRPMDLILEVVSISIIHNQIFYYLLSIPSVHEDTNIVQDINNVTLKTHTKQDKEVVLSSDNTDDKTSPSSGHS